MLFNLATKDDIKALSDQNANAYALNSTRIQLFEDRINQIESDFKNNNAKITQQIEERINQLESDLKPVSYESIKQLLKDQYEHAIQLIESKAQAAIQNLRAQYDLNMSTEDKNRMHIERLEDRILDLENPKPKKKKPAAKAKK